MKSSDIDSLIEKLKIALEKKENSKYIALSTNTISSLLHELIIARKHKQFIKNVLWKTHDN